MWLSPEQAGKLETLGSDAWPGRTVKTLLGRADSLKAQGLSWGEIARRWNAEGRRTERGAEFRGANISRDWRKWKGEG